MWALLPVLDFGCLDFGSSETIASGGDEDAQSVWYGIRVAKAA
jgi:hypothetical protein